MVKNEKSTKQKQRAVRHGRLKRSSAVKNIVRLLMTSFLVLGLSGIAVTAYAIWDLADNVETVSLQPKPQEDQIEEVYFSDKPIDGAFAIALIGSDTREGQVGYVDDVEGELNDVNILLYVDESHQNATVLSFSRDLMLPIPGCPGPNGEEMWTYPESEAQLNTALYKGGLVCVVRTLEEFTGIDIPYAGLITFDGVINMSNAIGGVEICLVEPIYDENTGLDLAAGDVTLVGVDALQFLRTRYGVGDGGDQSRISNQQVFMASMVRQLQDAATLADPGKVYRLAKAATENILLSDTLVSIPVMQSMATVLKDLDLERINFVQYPLLPHPYDPNRYSPNWIAGEELLAVMKSGQPFVVENLGIAAIEQDGVYEAEGSDVEGSVETGAGEDAIKINPSVTGQSAAKVTCSPGRTVW